MKFETQDMTKANIAKLSELFPGLVTEGKVNIDLLRSYIGEDFFKDEAYEFTWVGKREAITEAGRPIRKTLRPCIEESKNWDSTENLYIEGDNLDVLKLLQESYLGKVKMIYIDPPYNTGNDFVYKDNFTQSREEYEDAAGTYDEDGDRLFKNTESNGRFHSDWCSMMYPRLVLARNILSEDGVIFISIDDNEVAQLRKICDEVFGERNFLAQLVWERAYSPKNDAKYISNSHDYVIMYTKSINNFVIGRLERTEEANARYSNPDNDSRGVWKPGDMSVKTYNALYDFPIHLPSGRIIEPPTGRCWRFSKEGYEKALKDDRIYFGANGDSVPQVKRFLSELRYEGMAPTSIMFYKDVGHSQEGTKEVTALLEAGAFEGPKPVRLLRRLLTLANLSTDSFVLDFFSGSATTAHAVMQLNAEDGGNRKFIMVQLPEVTDEKSEAYTAGYKNICEIGKARIRRAGEKIRGEIEEKNAQTKLDGEAKVVPDIGFRVLKVADSNMNDVYYAASEIAQARLQELEDNIKADRSDLDLLFGCLLEWGLPLSMPHSHEKIDGFTVHTYNEGDLIACFEEKISDAAIREIAGRRPLRAVFRDSGFESSPKKINVFEIFKLLAPHTTVKVI